MIKIIGEDKNEVKSIYKVCHRFQPVIMPSQTVSGFDMKQINCYKERCELWYIEEGMCAEKYNYIKNKEGEVM